MYRVLSQDRVIDSGLFFFIHMEEILYLLTENNRMLKKICDYIDKVESKQYQTNEDFKNMMINLIANSLINRR